MAKISDLGINVFSSEPSDSISRHFILTSVHLSTENMLYDKTYLGKLGKGGKFPEIINIFIFN